MKRVVYINILVLTFLFPVFGQEHISVHELHKRQFGNQPLQKSFFNEDGKDIIPLRLNKAKSSFAVFGYLPYWEYQTERNLIQYDLLSHIALFDFQADAGGGLKKPSYWPWTDVINKAHSNGTKVIMCVTNFTGSEINNIITSDANKKNLITNIKNIIQQYSLDGVNIDFEGLNKADRGALINGFMSELTNTIHSDFPGKEVSYAGPVINWGGWDLPGLAKACDYIFIMGYDFNGSWSTNAGPSSPLIGGVYNLTTALTTTSFGYGAVIPQYSPKLILGVPYFGNRWQVTSTSPYAKVTRHVASTFFRSEIVNSQTHGLRWDGSSQTAWYYYQQDSLWVQDWFDTDSSINLKYNLAASKGLKGIGMWALGQDGDRPEMWNLLRKRVIADVKNDRDAVPSGFALSQNYPNPFNPSTIINYEIPRGSKVTLTVYDLLGKEVAVLVNEEKSAGRYSVEFKASLSSGVYYYKLIAGEYSASRKMVILK
ncbi:MAG: glycosyl hydrolase family 18 protein [Ignavibacteriales bacterium]